VSGWGICNLCLVAENQWDQRFKFGGHEDGKEEWFREGGSMRPLPKWDAVRAVQTIFYFPFLACKSPLSGERIGQNMSPKLDMWYFQTPALI
jgi:hypothetical protein